MILQTYTYSEVFDSGMSKLQYIHHKYTHTHSFLFSQLIFSGITPDGSRTLCSAE